MSELDSYMEMLYHLNVGVVGKGSERHERPHKPVMLLAVADLIGGGEIAENCIEWRPLLRKRFADLFDLVRAGNDKPTPENPFFYLRSEPFWHHEAKQGKEAVVESLSNPPPIRHLDEGLFSGKLDEGLFQLLRSEDGRQDFREALIARYFPSKRDSILTARTESTRVEEEDSSRARSSAFRHLILENYDYQCVACGVRLRLPNDITIVDAAHLIPFSVSRNDHPTNGFALCKNHHWAFDRHLITPTPEGVWRVSNLLEARRSKGESELIGLEGERLLPPRDEAYAPCMEAVEWRMERLWN